MVKDHLLYWASSILSASAALATGKSYMMHKLLTATLAGASLLSVSACTPTVQVAMPSEPITINLNVRIEHEIRVKVEQELDELFSEDSDLF